jgi:hypothetical protein
LNETNLLNGSRAHEPAKAAGGDAGVTLEDAREVRLIGEAIVDRDARQRRVG